MYLNMDALMSRSPRTGESDASYREKHRVKQKIMCMAVVQSVRRCSHSRYEKNLLKSILSANLACFRVKISASPLSL
jgi:hypothetical protein